MPKRAPADVDAVIDVIRGSPWNWMVAAALGLALTACGGTAPGTSPDVPRPTPPTATTSPLQETAATTEPEPARVSIEATVSRDERGLQVFYTVTNDGDAPVLVLTERGHDQSDSSTAPREPGSVWVSQASPDVARLSKQVFDTTPGTLLYAPWRAPAALVDHGERLDGEMSVPLPLRGDLPDASEALVHDEQPLTASPTLVEVCVQVAPSAGAEAYNDEITMDSPDRVLVCTGPLAVPPDE